MILVVERSRAMGEATCAALRAAGFEAIYALSATEAFINCQERRPDLLISEYLLAEESGLDLLKKLRRMDEAPPLLMVSALGDEATAAEAMGLGALGYMAKDAGYLDGLPALARTYLRRVKLERQEEERLRQKRRMQSQNELAGWMAHNFKNILSASLGYLNLIDFNNPAQDNGRRKSYLDDSVLAQRSAIDLLEKIDSLTARSDFSDVEAVDAGEVAAEAWTSACGKVISGLEAQRPQQAELLRARLTQLVFFNSARRLERVEMVRSDLFSALEALLCNALEAVARTESPRILVSGKRTGDRLELTVRDNGRGMDENVVRHAAEALFSTKGEVGVGLGLSLVSTIASRYDGELTFRSSPGEGTSARLSLKVEWPES